jgi:hypothetical protein
LFKPTPCISADDSKHWPLCQPLNTTRKTGEASEKARLVLGRLVKLGLRCAFILDRFQNSACNRYNQHTLGKVRTIAIEQDNSNTRHYLASMIRRIKVVSKSVEMVDFLEDLAVPENYRAL